MYEFEYDQTSRGAGHTPHSEKKYYYVRIESHTKPFKTTPASSRCARASPKKRNLNTRDTDQAAGANNIFFSFFVNMRMWAIVKDCGQTLRAVLTVYFPTWSFSDWGSSPLKLCVTAGKIWLYTVSRMLPLVSNSALGYEVNCGRVITSGGIRDYRGRIADHSCTMPNRACKVRSNRGMHAPWGIGHEA